MHHHCMEFMELLLWEEIIEAHMFSVGMRLEVLGNIVLFRGALPAEVYLINNPIPTSTGVIRLTSTFIPSTGINCGMFSA